MKTAAEAVRIAKEHVGYAYKWGGDFDGSADIVTPENVRAWRAAYPEHYSDQKVRWLLDLFLGQPAGDCINITKLPTKGMRIPL
jgi:hypothetical protein